MIPYYVTPKKDPITQAVSYYAQIAPCDPVALLDVTASISNKCTVTEHDVKAVLAALEQAIADHLAAGESVRFGDLGSFRPTIGGLPAETAEKCTVSHIKKVRAVYTQSARLSSIFSDVSALKFEKVIKQ